jgi:transposase
MARQVCVVLRAVEREQLATIAADGNGPRKHIERAHIVLASADQHAARQVPQSIGVSRPTVWRWQQRVAESGIDVLLRDKTRKPGKAPSAAETAARVVARACAEPPHVATQWTGRATAKAIGILLGSVQRIWEAHKLQPHRLRTFKRSRDPGFADKLNDVVGLYVDPPARAGVLPIDEKSQIQPLDRTQPWAADQAPAISVARSEIAAATDRRAQSGNLFQYPGGICLIANCAIHPSCRASKSKVPTVWLSAHRKGVKPVYGQVGAGAQSY